MCSNTKRQDEAGMTGDKSNIKPLLLAGGMSSRMGQPKHLLRLPDGQILLSHILHQMVLACPWAETLYISLRCRNPTEMQDIDTLLGGKIYRQSVRLIYDTDASHSHGPAAGMIAAHLYDPQATYLVVAVDFPFLTSQTLNHLVSQYKHPVSCFVNDQGFIEPLLGIWSPEALGRLADNAQRNSWGPSRVVKQFRGHQIRVPEGCEQWLRNTNTPEEWDEAMTMFESKNDAA